MTDIKHHLPEVGEGWSWELTEVEMLGHEKVCIELLLHDVPQRVAFIDVGLYGKTHAVIERARGLLKSVVDEQLASTGV